VEQPHGKATDLEPLLPGAQHYDPPRPGDALDQGAHHCITQTGKHAAQFGQRLFVAVHPCLGCEVAGRTASTIVGPGTSSVRLVRSEGGARPGQVVLVHHSQHCSGELLATLGSGLDRLGEVSLLTEDGSEVEKG
jgi:hypothetical protein